MLCEVPLTKEQQAFASDHHGLVYKFLNENHLPEDEFYDVIIFGYLRAVYRYFNEPKLQKYSFATIGWKSMQGALSNYNPLPNSPQAQYGGSQYSCRIIS